MPKNNPVFKTLDAYLAADVANGGTFTTAYPAGTTQADFATGLASPGSSYAMVNDTDKWDVSAGKASFAYGASLITITNNSGVTWKAGSKVSLQLGQAASNNVTVLQVPLLLASVTANGAVFNPGIVPGVEGALEYYEGIIKAAATTAAKAATLVPTIDGVDVTGGALALTSAGATPANLVLPAPLITGANTLKQGSRLNFRASAVTAFSEGEIVLNCRIRHVGAARNFY